MDIVTLSEDNTLADQMSKYRQGLDGVIINSTVETTQTLPTGLVFSLNTQVFRVVAKGAACTVNNVTIPDGYFATFVSYYDSDAKSTIWVPEIGISA